LLALKAPFTVASVKARYVGISKRAFLGTVRGLRKCKIQAVTNPTKPKMQRNRS
jgi:hypothetical protein